VSVIASSSLTVQMARSRGGKAFVALLRNHAEIVLTNANRESPKSAALPPPFPQRSLPSWRAWCIERFVRLNGRRGRLNGPMAPAGSPGGHEPPTLIRPAGVAARAPGSGFQPTVAHADGLRPTARPNRQKAATQPATHAARRTVEHDLDLCNLGVRALGGRSF
jgi:hypothetical protein